MKSKRFLLGIVASVSVAVTALTVALLGSNSPVKWVGGTDGSVWNHYSAVAPKLDKKGIKEYWVNCSSHESVFSAPASENIVDKGEPTEAFIKSLPESDSRLLKRSWQPLGFTASSDADKIFSVRNNFNVKTIVDLENTPDNDGKALELTYKDGTADFMLDEAYLDNVFADSNVVELRFNAKMVYSAAEYKDISYRQQASTVRYEGNGANYFGLNKTWKTFAYPRSAYEAFKSDPSKSTVNRNTFLWLGLSDTYSSFELYLDNFYPSTTSLDYLGGFEKGRFDESKTYFSWRNGTGSEIFHASNCDGLWSFDESIKTEGGRSLKVVRENNESISFGFNQWSTILPESTSIISFDFRTSTLLNCNANASTLKLNQNDPLSTGSDFQIPANTWVRFAIPKSAINRASVIGIAGSAKFTFWIDNIQVCTNTGCFEDDTIIQKNLNYWSYNGDYVNSSNQTKSDYVLVRTLSIQGNSQNVKHVGLSSTRKTEGNKSLWLEVASGSTEIALYTSVAAKKFLTDNAGSTIGIDVYRTSSGNLTFTDGNRNALTVPNADSWTHYS